MRFQRVPEIADKVPEGSGADGQKPPKIFQAAGDNA